MDSPVTPQGHDIIVIGASAGGLEALTPLVQGLPADLPAALFVVLHIPAQSPSMLASILNRTGPLMAIHAVDETPIRHGCIYVAAPDRHLELRPGRVKVPRGPKENGHRPAIDPLFRSAAHSYGARVVGVVLSGSLDDGTAGLASVKQHGGVTVVQDPADALFPDMPLNALEQVQVDHTVPAAEMAALLTRLAGAPRSTERDDLLALRQAQEPDHGMLSVAHDKGEGEPSVFSCPACGGVLWEMHEDQIVRYRCRIGHAFSIGSMAAEQARALETALGVALKILEERAHLHRRMADRAAERGAARSQKRFMTGAQEADEHATRLRDMLSRGAPPLLESEES